LLVETVSMASKDSKKEQTFTKKEGYGKQVAIYLRNKENEKAYELAKEFLGKFPDDLIANVLFSESAYRAGKYEEARDAGRNAFNMAKSEDDMLFCAMVTSSSYLQLRQFAAGYQMLREMERKVKTPDLEEALFVFAMALKDQDEALKHMDRLYQLDRKRGDLFMARVLKALP